MPSSRAAHLSSHPCPPCAEMGLIQHAPAPPSSPLSWPPLSLQVYRPGWARSAATSPALHWKVWAGSRALRILEPMQIHLSLINLACIMHVSCMYPQAYLVCIQRGPDEASKIHVSWLSILMYLDVSWWRVQDTRILMYPDMYPVWHQGSAQDTCILLYLICIPKMYLGLLWDTCKMSRYMYSLRM